MKTVLRTTLQPNGLFRLGLFIVNEAGEGGVIKAWQMKGGHFRMPRSAKEATSIAEYDLPRSRREFDRAASVISAYLA